MSTPGQHRERLVFPWLLVSEPASGLLLRKITDFIFHSTASAAWAADEGFRCAAISGYRFYGTASGQVSANPVFRPQPVSMQYQSNRSRSMPSINEQQNGAARDLLLQGLVRNPKFNFL
jgi:hypothetical protein